MRIEFELYGRVVPYVRMTRRGKFVKPQAQRYLASKEALALQFLSQMQKNEIAPVDGQPLSVTILFGGIDRRQDLDNLVKAVLDAGNGVVWNDDRWVDRIRAERTHDESPGLTLVLVETLEKGERDEMTLQTPETKAKMQAALRFWSNMDDSMRLFLRSLHWRIRRAVEMVHGEGCTTEQVAERLGVSRSTVSRDVAAP